MQIKNKTNCYIIQNVVSIFPFMFILAMLLVHLLLPDKTFSKEEQRYLAQWPDFHSEKVLNDSYEVQVESYFTDQFPFRNFWLHIQKGFNQILLKG